MKFSENESYIKLNENNQEIGIKLKNHKEYYGYKFYRFSSFSSESEVAKTLNENGYDIDYNQENKRIIVNYENVKCEIIMEEQIKVLGINRYNYIFQKQNKMENIYE